jgi:type IV pilus assembly protein PilM
VAVWNALAYDLAPGDGDAPVMVLDLGARVSDLLVVGPGRTWMRTLSVGGDHFTDRLVRDFALDWMTAEKRKRSASTSKYARQLFQSMRPAFTELVDTLTPYLYNEGRLDLAAEPGPMVHAERFVCLGLTSRLPGLRRFLEQNLNVQTEVLEGFRRLETGPANADTFRSHALEFVTAYGAALMGLGLAPLTLDFCEKRRSLLGRLFG